MNDNMDFIDVSDDVVTENKKKKDVFMIFVYTSLILLVILGSIIYFFGYELLKPFIKV